MPDIDYVIQFDPPQDPKSFSHRCGRTARSGKNGSALVFLGPKEDTYIEFLKIRKVPMQEWISNSVIALETDSEQLFSEIVKINKSDREIYEKSIKAFVSWIRYYNEHQANFIFNLKNVELGQVARAFGLFKLPKMPELNSLKIEFKPLNIDAHKIQYLDKQREKQRQEKLKNTPKPTFSMVHKPVAWSHQKEMKEKRLDRREKKTKRKIAIAKAKVENSNPTSMMDDWLEMQTEARKLKRKTKKALSDTSDDDL